MFGFYRLDCAVVVTVYHSHLPLLFYFQAHGDEKHHRKTDLRCGTLRSRRLILANLACGGGGGGFASSGCHRPVFNSRTFPQLAYTNAQLWPPHSPSYHGYKYHAGPRLNLQRSCPDSSRVKGHLAGSWRGFLGELTRETAERRAEGRTAASLAAVAYWTESTL